MSYVCTTGELLAQFLAQSHEPLSGRVSPSQRYVESAHTPNEVPSGRTASTHGWLW